MGRYNLSPSRVARYYFHECDRFLRYSATPKHLKDEEGVPPYQLDHSLLTKAILNSGFDREGEVLAPGQYIYQSTLIATDSFYERYGLDGELVEFGECNPDLLMITSGEDGGKVKKVPG